MQDGSRDRYDSITLPSEVYLNKLVVSKNSCQVRNRRILQRI
jgi:hypothetical protein